ncbi:MAG: hypothetical protein F6K28_17995 [Microcoleus sp. SIO2G3]|nr:hypothetical protein [Microcoleus sp. SIO2G3]
MSKLTLSRFNSSALRFEEAEAQVRQAWNSACNCPSPGERIECWNCPYYKHLGKLTQQKLHRTPEKVFAEIPPPEPLDPYSIEVKEQCCQMYRQGYSAEDIQKLVGVPSRRVLRGWLREVGLPSRSAQYPEPIKQRCLEMYAQRCSPREIENETGVPADTVTDWAMHAGISRKRKYSDETQQSCLDLYQQGHTSDEIHQLTGIPAATIRMWVWKVGVSRGQKRFSEADKQKCQALYEQGKSPREIETLTSIPGATIGSWVRKEAWTRVNPSELLSGGELASLLNEAAQESSPRKPDGYWKNFENVEREILELNVLRGQIGIMPKARELKQLGRGDLMKAISKHHGGYQSVAERMGLDCGKKRHRYWYDFANVEAELKTFIERQGTPGVMPTKTELEEAGKGSLANALGLHGGVIKVAERLNLKLGYDRRPQGYWDNPDNLRREIESVALQLGTPGVLPTHEELKLAQRSDLICAISRNGGWPSVARRLGFAYSKKYNNPSDYF